MVVLASVIVIALMVAIGACSSDSNDRGSTTASSKSGTTVTVPSQAGTHKKTPARRKNVKSVTVPMEKRKGTGPINGKVTLSKVRGSQGLRIGITVSVPRRRYGVLLFSRGRQPLLIASAFPGTTLQLVKMRTRRFTGYRWIEVVKAVGQQYGRVRTVPVLRLSTEGLVNRLISK